MSRGSLFPDEDFLFPASEPLARRLAPRSSKLRTVLAWDGALPLLVSSSPLILPICLPQVDRVVIGFFAMGVIPVVAALTRAHMGSLQLARLFQGATPIGRQCVFALAIIVVFFFEAVSCAFHCRGNQPAKLWLIPAALYALYFLLAYVALRPARSPTD